MNADVWLQEHIFKEEPMRAEVRWRLTLTLTIGDASNTITLFMPEAQLIKIKNDILNEWNNLQKKEREGDIDD